ncbi:MAG: dihydropteroate synthase [Armatimonadota bacterium]|nr:dihydropteroate synthase [Armatimonadota bacterium]MDR5697601.1 dihydropteroate synthase [Armatimonadota bacterium]
MSGRPAAAVQWEFVEWPGPSVLRLRDRALDLSRVHVVGILNVTDDSFYAAARHPSPAAAVARAYEIASEGADLIEVGGESARPGPPVDESEELRRVVPLVERIVAEVGLPVVVETVKPVVACEAVAAGAVCINDVSGLRRPEVAEAAASAGAGLVIMHRRGPHKVPAPTVEGDVVAEVCAFLREKAESARAIGVGPDRILIDPGFSFDKTPAQDAELLRRLAEVAGLGYPIYLATSRKNYLRDLLGLPAEQLLEATLAAVALAIERGARVVRAHDVRAVVRVARIVEAVLRTHAAERADVGGDGWT